MFVYLIKHIVEYQKDYGRYLGSFNRSLDA